MISDEAKAILALEEEISFLQAEAAVLNVQINKLHTEHLKQIKDLSNRHEFLLLKTIQCEKAIHETKKLLCKSGHSY